MLNCVVKIERNMNAERMALQLRNIRRNRRVTEGNVLENHRKQPLRRYSIDGAMQRVPVDIEFVRELQARIGNFIFAFSLSFIGNEITIIFYFSYFYVCRS